FDRRLFLYFADLYKRDNLPVYPIVVFSFASPRKQQPSSFDIVFPDLHVLGFRYRVVQLNQLDWRGFLKYRNPAASALMARMWFAPEEKVEVKLECMRTLARLNLAPDKLRIATVFIDSYLKLTGSEERKLREAIGTLGI